MELLLYILLNLIVQYINLLLAVALLYHLESADWSDLYIHK